MKGESSNQGNGNGKGKGKAPLNDEELGDMSSERKNRQEPTQKISLVPAHVKTKNIDAYLPKLVSIGPYHHGEPQLQSMEIHKRRAQDKLVNASKLTINDYKAQMMEVVKTLRESYADLDDVKWSDDKFIGLMILDGCFLIEFFSNRLGFYENYQANDPIFSERGYGTVKQDLLMVENQLPYLAVQKLLEISGKNPNVISNWIRPGVEELGFHMLETYMGGLLKLGVESTQFRAPGLCASELYLYNVKFKRGKNYTDINFNSENGNLTLPILIIDEHTISTYLNMNALALTQASSTAKTFAIYARLLGTLVESTKDIILLQSHGIIVDELGDQEGAVKVIRDIAGGTFSSDVATDGKGTSYNSLQEKLDKFCKKKETRCYKTVWLWLEDLVKTTFKNPWTTISFLAAIVLLALTATQTHYAILSYKKEEQPGTTK
ncbi:hypothetical protein MKW94_006367 [Papaver nudicaule]|uniref:Uncharacterized protein n=1 Tax=Papaver nudicaule TaxID=74823 RepID=A0AA41VSG9_PAPNU|nr:hypothetical protein [Papaver nudicaule]